MMLDEQMILPVTDRGLVVVFAPPIPTLPFMTVDPFVVVVPDMVSVPLILAFPVAFRAPALTVADDIDVVAVIVPPD